MGETTPPEWSEIEDWLLRVPKVTTSTKLRERILGEGQTLAGLKALWSSVVNTPKVKDRKAFFVSQIFDGAKAGVVNG